MNHMAPAGMVKAVEHCRVTPPPGTVADSSLPLTFFDIPWLPFHPIQRLLFYEFPHSKTHFTHTIIPNLKDSISLTLKHFYLLAGNLIFPPNSSEPEIRYVDGDSVSLTFAESNNDFNHLTGNYDRNADEFYPLVPQLAPASMLSGTLVAPVLALQVTLFPNSGICVGFTNHHAASDGSAFTNFIRSWTSITKLGGDAKLLASGSLPSYDRTIIKDPNGLETIFWSQVGNISFEGSKPQQLSTNNVLATFCMGQADVQQLKKLVSARYPALLHISTFTVTCAYVWACMIKARASSGEKVGEDELEHFIFAANCRALLDPPIPNTYFGNCLAPCLVSAKSTQLMGEDGFLIAAEVIVEAVQERLHNGEGVLKGAERWIPDIGALKPERLVGVAGSPKFMLYNMDFGWGRPKKAEVVSIDVTGPISFNHCRDGEGNMEVGLCFSKIKMDAFAAIFANGLKV